MEISILNVDIIQVPTDLIVLKFADEFYGADQTVAKAIGFNSNVAKGDAIFCHGGGKVAARDVLFIGVGPLHKFRYENIQEFGSRAIKLARKYHDSVRNLAMTIHGPGYGLDPEQAFLSMLAGIVSEWKLEKGVLQKVTIVDRSDKRCDLLGKILVERLDEFGLRTRGKGAAVTQSEAPAERLPATNSNIIQFGARAEEGPRLFVAMPFADEFIDEYEIGFHEAAKASHFICERLDLQTFTGDIVAEMKKRIVESHGVVALVNGHNPNVFLEIGFALAYGKPTILVAKAGVDLPFDVRSHRCIRYQNINQLRNLLKAEIASLKMQGLLARGAKLD
jgi:hypothetical protein